MCGRGVVVLVGTFSGRSLGNTESSGCRICKQSNWFIRPGLFQFTRLYIHKSQAYYNNLSLITNNGNIYNCYYCEKIFFHNFIL